MVILAVVPLAQRMRQSRWALVRAALVYLPEVGRDRHQVEAASYDLML
eukprot:COSAG02_NODE_19410_length_883_cov_1.089286_2_plen_47_part_01